MPRSLPAALVLAAAALAGGAAHGQSDRPGQAAVQVNPPGSTEPAPPQPDKAYRPAERDKALEKPANGCSCSGNNRCYHSLDFNYCVAPDGHRVYMQRYWGQ
jgi:hypothetical protein